MKHKLLNNKRLGLICCILLSTEVFSPKSQAQVTPDQTLGNESSTVNPIDALKERIDGGARRGGNLFHSFQEFNIGEGRGVYFSNPQGVINIFSRVTGGNPSQILGKLGVLGDSNLFFLNPNGIIFGANASLALGGSLIVSTAKGIQFADGTEFKTTTSQENPLLTISVPIGLQFDSSAESIVNQSKFTTLLPSLTVPNTLELTTIGLAVSPGKTLALVGGEIILEGGSLTALNGRIELGSVNETAKVSLTPIAQGWKLGYENVETFQDIRLSEQSTINASTIIDTQDSGSISIYSRNLSLTDESRIISLSFGTKPTGTIDINVLEAIEITGTGNYVQFVKAFSMGTISLDLSLNLLRNGIFSVNDGTGGSNDIVINTRRLIQNNGAFIVTSNFGQGQGGNLSINAQDSVELAASVLGTGADGDGDAGDLTIITGKLRATEASLVSTSTLGKGKGGTINVHANSVHLIGGQAFSVFNDTFTVNTSLISGTLRTGASGDVRVETGQLILQDGAQLTANTMMEGQSGNIQVDAQSVLLKNDSFLFALSLGKANAGQIIVRVQETLQLDNSTITARAERSTGGNINITASKIDLVGNSVITTNVTSGTGGGGNITLNADSILAFDNSDILAFAQDGQGGNIILNTPIFFGNGYQATDEINRNPNDLNNNDLADINASGAVSGIINVPDLTVIQNSLVELPETLINTENLIANSCVVPNEQQAGTFIMRGADGLPSRPGNNLISPYPTGTVETIPPESNSPPAKMNEPQGFYRLPDGRIVLSRKCS